MGKGGLWGYEVVDRGAVGSSPLVKHPAMNLSQLVPISTVAGTSSSKDCGGLDPRKIKEALSKHSPAESAFFFLYRLSEIRGIRRYSV